MSREVDLRSSRPARLTSARTKELHALAASASSVLPGSHRIHIARFDSYTGNPSLIVSEFAPLGQGDFIQRALDHLQALRPVLGLQPSQPFEFSADPSVSRTSTGATAVHTQQKYKSIPIFQSAQTVRFQPNGALTEVAGSVTSVMLELNVGPTVSVQDAVLAAARHVASPQPDEQAAMDQFGAALTPQAVDIASFTPKRIAAFAEQPEQFTVFESGPFGDELKASLRWFELGDTLRLAWEVIVPLPNYEEMYRVLVDGQDSRILYCKQLIRSISAQGHIFRGHGGQPRQPTPFPRPLTDYPVSLPDVTLPPGFPDDWVSSTSTSGNAVVVRVNGSESAPQGTMVAQVLTFDPPADSAEQKALNAFYYCCFIHDYLYLLGFREGDGNFQRDNLGRGGIPNDPLEVRPYTGPVSGTANMYTPVDGLAPIMNLGLLSSTTRHTALDSSVVYHEYVHGLTNRLVGGPLNDNAMERPQSQGLGEGFSDYFACTLTQQTTVGGWVANSPAGIRLHPYDESFPDGFGSLGTGRYLEVHNIGEICCAILMSLNRRLGVPFTPRLVVDALKLIPANPSFIDMRDALLSALQHLRAAGKLSATDFERKQADAWSVFARYGLGPNASSDGPSLSNIVADTHTPAPTSGPLLSWGNSQLIGAATNLAPAQSRIGLVARRPTRLEVALSGFDGGVYSNAWDESDGRWRTWSRIGASTDRVPQGTPVTLVARDPTHLDVFTQGFDGGIYHASWEESGAAWSPWQRIGAANDRAPSGSVVTAITQAGVLRLFIVGFDGGIYENALPGGGGWRGWQRVGTASEQVPTQSVISAIARPARVDIFVTGADGGVYTNASVSPTSSWSGWRRIGSQAEVVPLRTAIAVVAPSPERLDAFVAAGDGGVYGSAWRDSSNAWSGWQRIGTAGERVSSGTGIAAVTRRGGSIDLFVVGSDGALYVNTWLEQGNQWRGWSQVPGLPKRLPVPSTVSAVSRGEQLVELVMVDIDLNVRMLPGSG